MKVERNEMVGESDVARIADDSKVLSWGGSPLVGAQVGWIVPVFPVYISG